MKKKKNESIILLIVVVIIPSLIYFVFFSQRNNIVCAHTFTDDATSTLLGTMEEYKQELNSINKNIDSNITLSHLYLKDISDQAYITRIANYFYPNESKSNGGDLTNSFNRLNSLFSLNMMNKSIIKDVKDETSKSALLLDECKQYFFDKDLTKNNTISALTINNLVDSVLRSYELGTIKDANQNVLSIKDKVDYQNAIDLTNKSKYLLINGVDKSQFSNDPTKMDLFKNLKDNFDTLESYIKNNENYNKVMILVHMDIKSNLQKLFNLK